MKHSDEEVRKIILIVIEDLNYPLKQDAIEGVNYAENDKFIRGESKGEEFSSWTVAFNDSTFDTTDFFIISDETGEPLYAQSKHGVTEIIKDEAGKYKWKD